MNAIYDFLTAKKKAMEAQAALLAVGADIQPKYEYDSDEDIDGGTWEHKKRMLEMEATKGKLINIVNNLGCNENLKCILLRRGV